jgi:exodeoxyribonuclease VII large subunit
VSAPDSLLPLDAAPSGNLPAYTISELSQALKRTIEDAYGFVRLRGEISKVTRHASGHVYLTLKDDKACIDAVVWRTAVRGLACQPETGLEVVVTGRVTTYPARSSYQLIVETMSPAGIGALLAQLERLKARLKAEGLFDAARKQPLPGSPRTIGVITSPTGAVIRDILHRLVERWPCRVLLWPVPVQGADAAARVAEAIRGMNRLDPDGLPPRPDVLIVARGGGSVEDLWPFNDEALARTAAESRIPLISAVGHETDVTLIDYVADRRAPTPTAAAEIATPVLADLRASLSGLEQRLQRTAAAGLEVRRARLAAAVRGLARPQDLLGLAGQRFDIAAGRLGAALQRNAALHERALAGVGARLGPHLLARAREAGARRVADLEGRLRRAGTLRLERAREALLRLDQLRLSFDPDGPLRRGFARVHRADGTLARSAAALEAGELLRLVFQDGARRAEALGPAEADAERAPSVD